MAELGRASKEALEPSPSPALSPVAIALEARLKAIAKALVDVAHLTIPTQLAPAEGRPLQALHRAVLGQLRQTAQSLGNDWAPLQTQEDIDEHKENRWPNHLFAEHFEVLDRYGRLAFSRRYAPPTEKGKLLIDPTHYQTLPRRPRRPGFSRRLDQAFIDRYPSLAPLVSGLQVRMKSLAPVQLRALLRLADRYDHHDFVAAATKAQDFKCFDAHAVERILQRDVGAGHEEPIAPLGGFGPLLVGDVDPGNLDAYAHLDSRQEVGPDDQNPETDHGTYGTDQKED